MQRTRIIALAVAVGCLALFYGLDLHRYLTFTFFQQLNQDSPLLTTVVFMVAYIVVTALSLPFAVVLTLLAGALFGVGYGVLLVSFASTIGATLGMLFARTLLRDWAQNRMGRHLKAINEGIERDGPFYLFSLRLIPVMPFVVVNMAMGLTGIRLWTFYWVSQLGMLAGTVVYVNAGAQLSQIDQLSVTSIMTPQLLLSFAALGVFPWLARGLVALVRNRALYRPFRKPKKFDTNVVVIGAGSGGLVSAYIAAAVKAKVSLVEKKHMGGDCLNSGCVPSKTLIRSAKIKHDSDRAAQFGLQSVKVEVDFSAVMERVQRVIAAIEPHDSVARYTALGVDCLSGTARLLSPWEVATDDGRTITARNVILATGGRPLVPAIAGLDSVDYDTSDTIWSLRQQPKRLLVLGGGPIGCEMAQAFNRLGSQVTLVDRADRILIREDSDVSDMIAARFESEGIDLKLEREAIRFGCEEGGQWLEVKHRGTVERLEFDRVLLALGRQPNSANLGLEALGIDTAVNGTVLVNDYMQTRYPNIYACGDLAGPYQFTHTAAHQAWYAVVNALFGRIRKFRVDYSVIPWATFVDPEVARVGLNEQDAKAQGIEYELTRYDHRGLDRALADGENYGFTKVLTVPGRDTILGCTIVGSHAGELITEYVTAMKHGFGMNKILSTIHIYPTLSESNKFAAGEWKKAHAPQWALALLQRFHTWSRG